MSFARTNINKNDSAKSHSAEELDSTVSSIQFETTTPSILPADSLIFIEEPDKALGEGTSGIVYNGLYRPTNAHSFLNVAVKVYHDQYNDDDYSPIESDYPSSANIALSEASALLQFRSPYIVRCYGVVFSTTQACLVTELMDGGNLEDALENERIESVHTKLDIALAIANALSEIHDVNYVYGDLKSANILLTANKQAKLADFDRTTHQSRVEMSGTIPYIAPELCRMKPTKHSDIYSFGMLLLELMQSDHRFYDAFSAYQEEGQSFYFLNDLEEGKVTPLTDYLIDSIQDNDAIAALIIQCLDPIPENRPDAKHIVLALYSLINKSLAPTQPNSAISSREYSRQSSDDLFYELATQSTSEKKRVSRSLPLMSGSALGALSLFSLSRKVTIELTQDIQPVPALRSSP
jgi:serine/threonine protein kinase